MIFDGLIPLHASMQAQDISRYKFEYTHGRGQFDIFFFIDESPFKLLIGARGGNFAITVNVDVVTFKISTYIGKFNELCEFLELEFKEGNPFSTNAFFADLNCNIPSTASRHNVPRPSEIAEYVDNVLEADKVHFVGWLDNNIQGNQVSEENLDKTRRLLGFDVYEICRRKNISSRWSPHERDSVEITTPD